MGKNPSAKTNPLLFLLLFGLVLSAINMRSPIVMIGSVVSTLHDTLGLTAVHIGYLGALPMPLFAIGALVAPKLASRFGLWVMMFAMTILLSVGVAGRVWFGVIGLFVGTFLLSLAIGMLNALTAPFIKKYAPNHIALATGVFSLSMSFFAGIAAWVIVPMMTVISWQLALSSWAVFGFLTLVIWYWIKQKSPQHTQVSAMQSTTFNPWKNKHAWYMGIFMGLQSFLFYSVASFLPSIGRSFGLSQTQATKPALMFQVVAPIAIFVLTFLMKRGVSVRLIALVSALLNAFGVGGLIWLPEHIVTWSVVMGLGGASIFTLSLMMFSIRTSDVYAARDLSGMVQAVGYTIALFGPLGLGKLFEMTQSWQMPLYLLFVAMIINVGFGYMAGRDNKVD